MRAKYAGAGYDQEAGKNQEQARARELMNGSY